MPNPSATRRNPWAWVSTLYLAEGLPYVVVMTVAVIVYKELGLSNTDITLYTSWFYLPWVIKPLWSPVVDLLQTRRRWIWFMQILIGGGLAGVALSIPTAHFLQYSLAFFWLLAFSSATQDIAIDGFYMLAATPGEQAYFVGIRSTFYRIATIFGQGLLVILAGFIQDHAGLPKMYILVAARPGAAQIQTALPATNFSALVGDLRIVIESETVEINPQPRPRKETEALIAQARSNNVLGGFYPAPPEIQAAHHVTTPFRAVMEPVESFLRDHFSPAARVKSDLVGNIGMAAVCLSKPPGKNVVVTVGSRLGFGLGSGMEKLFSVAEGSRLSFNDQNWNHPALVVIQLDSKLKTTAGAVMEVRGGNLPLAWSVAFLLLAFLFVCFGVYHWWFLPLPIADRPGSAGSLEQFNGEFGRTFLAFFRKGKICRLLLFLLCYRFAEAQLVKMVAPFLLDARESGGLGLTTGQFGFVYGTVGIAALTFGGLLGGWLAARQGLKFWFWWMALAIHLPDAVFVYLAYARPENLWIINLGVAVEQFGYGFGFTAYMLYMLYIARGEHPTAHYALCTGFMALGMMLPGMFSGWLQELIGYQHFFVWVLLATIPGFLVVALVPLDPTFGRKSAS